MALALRGEALVADPFELAPDAVQHDSKEADRKQRIGIENSCKIVMLPAQQLDRGQRARRGAVAARGEKPAPAQRRPGPGHVSHRPGGALAIATGLVSHGALAQQQQLIRGMESFKEYSPGLVAANFRCLAQGNQP